MTAILTDPEIQSLRRHLEWGNISVAAYPYTPDGFYEVFSQVISPNLQTGAETTATTAITANSIAVVTPVSMTGIAVNTRLVVDVGDDAEIVTVKATTGATFTARFAQAHTAAGYPIAVQSGLAELRMLIHAADNARTALLSPDIATYAGLQSVDKGDVVWATGSNGDPNPVLSGIRAQYAAIVEHIASLVRVPRNMVDGGCGRLESY